jgi:PRTRC genetic system protein E
MFSELMPLLAERTVLITVARESDTTIRVNVCPKRTSANENAALSTPLSFVGTPEELDRDFGRALAGYVVRWASSYDLTCRSGREEIGLPIG